MLGGRRREQNKERSDREYRNHTASLSSRDIKY